MFWTMGTRSLNQSLINEYFYQFMIFTNKESEIYGTCFEQQMCINAWKALI